MLRRFPLPLQSGAQRLLRILVNRDVPQDAREGDPPGRRPRGKSELQRKLGSVLSPSGQLDRRTDHVTLPGFDETAETLGVPIAEPFGHQGRQWLSDQLVRGVAEGSFGSVVEVRDVAPCVGRDDRIERRLGHGAEPFLAVLNGFLRSPPLDHTAELGADLGHHLQQ